MQSITTGLSMETFFDILILCLLSYSIYQNFAMSKKIKTSAETLDALYENQEILLKDFGIFHTKVDHFLSKTDFSSQEPTHAPTKPIKPNNWDSVREAFKGPVRIEINERN
jgi:hypothetical protein